MLIRAATLHAMDKEKGRKAFAALRVYTSMPPETGGAEAQSVKGASASKLKCPYVTLGNISRVVGWKE